MNSSLQKILVCIFLPFCSLPAQEPVNAIECLSTRGVTASVACRPSGDSISINAITGIKRRIKITRDCYPLAPTYTSNFVDMGDGQTYTGSKKGIALWDSYASLEITTENSHIPEDHVTALALDADDNLWIGTYQHGIVIGVQKGIRPFKVQRVTTRDNGIFSIYVDKRGLVWVAYRSGGLECFSHGISCAYFPS